MLDKTTLKNYLENRNAYDLLTEFFSNEHGKSAYDYLFLVNNTDIYFLFQVSKNLNNDEREKLRLKLIENYVFGIENPPAPPVWFFKDLNKGTVNAIFLRRRLRSNTSTSKLITILPDTFFDKSERKLLEERFVYAVDNFLFMFSSSITEAKIKEEKIEKDTSGFLLVIDMLMSYLLPKAIGFITKKAVQFTQDYAYKIIYNNDTLLNFFTSKGDLKIKFYNFLINKEELYKYFVQGLEKSKYILESVKKTPITTTNDFADHIHVCVNNYHMELKINKKNMTDKELIVLLDLYLTISQQKSECTKNLISLIHRYKTQILPMKLRGRGTGAILSWVPIGNKMYLSYIEYSRYTNPTSIMGSRGFSIIFKKFIDKDLSQFAFETHKKNYQNGPIAFFPNNFFSNPIPIPDDDSVTWWPFVDSIQRELLWQFIQDGKVIFPSLMPANTFIRAKL